MPRPIAKRELFDLIERLDALGVSTRGIERALAIGRSSAARVRAALGVDAGRYRRGLSDEGVVRFEVLRADPALSAKLESLRECSRMKRRPGRRLT